MLRTDDVAQFVAISGLMNYCASHGRIKIDGFTGIK